MVKIMTVEETKEGLNNLAEKLESFIGIIKNTGFIISGELEVSEETKKQISEKLQEFNEGFWSSDFRAVVSATLKLDPNIVHGDFSQRIDRTTESSLLPTG